MRVNGYKKGKKFRLVVMAIGLGFYLEIQAAHAFLDMKAAAEADGIKLKVNTAFRTMEHQRLLRRRYDEYVAAKAEGKEAAPVAYAATPGWSNHQAGISVDVNRAQGDNLKTKIPDSPTDKWLKHNAATYGFVFDAPKEPWHLSFRPDLAAKVINGEMGVYDILFPSQDSI